ncbi:MAG: hypothetical protein OEY07_05930 [Gammaproteobacteria bacterium]|nr:hypothetical protein [Gammaproteobacteria bacterium]
MRRRVFLILIATGLLSLVGCGSQTALVKDGGLQVQKQAQSGLSWPEAVQYCKELGMRLPDKRELVDRISPAWKTPWGNYWTRTKSKGKPCVVATSYGISNCKVPSKNRKMLTRCVTSANGN